MNAITDPIANPVDSSALSTTIRMNLATYDFHMKEARRLKCKIQKSRQNTLAYLKKKDPRLNGWTSGDVERTLRAYIETNRHDILRMYEARHTHSQEAAKVKVSREMHLAHSYLKGRTYEQCERTCRELPSPRAIVKCIPKSSQEAIAREQECVLERCLQMWVEERTLSRKEIESEGIKQHAIGLAARVVKNIRDGIWAQERCARDAQITANNAQHRAKEIVTHVENLRQQLVCAEQKYMELKTNNQGEPKCF